MIKFFAVPAVLAVLGLSPAFAADKLMCDDASMSKVEMMTKDAMGKPEMKKMEDMAMKETAMAMEMKNKGDMEGCAMHLNMAQEQLMMKP